MIYLPLLWLIGMSPEEIGAGVSEFAPLLIDSAKPRWAAPALATGCALFFYRSKPTEKYDAGETTLGCWLL